MEIVDFIKPSIVLEHSQNVFGINNLFENDFQNNFICPKKYCLVKGCGYMILDFHKEYFGGIRLSFGNNKYNSNEPFVRIRFGESLMETCSELNEKGSSNDHSTRDLTVYMSSHSDMVWGSTGFRFVRIDFVKDGEFQIENIFLAFKHEEEPQLFFNSNNRKLNDIMQAALRTIWLNKHNGVFFEGAKRDQHVWAGDLYPELLAALYSFDNIESVRNSIFFIINNYQLPVWYNGIPSYNAWFVLTILRYFDLTGDINKDFLKCVSDNLIMFTDYLGKESFKNCLDDNWGLTFFDWSTWENNNRISGIKFLFVYTLQQILKSEYIDRKEKSIAANILNKYEIESFEITDSKAVNSIALLVGLFDKQQLIKELKHNCSDGFTAFLSYFILESLAQNGELKFAYDAALEYFGGMIEAGGTTLFEEFDTSWLNNSCKLYEKPKHNQKDFHGDFGKHCYVGYRKSLCHGWSCGIIPFVIENIVGIHIRNGNRLSIKPNLLDLDFLECKIPTSSGFIHVEVFKKNGKTETIYDYPANYVLEGGQ